MGWQSVLITQTNPASVPAPCSQVEFLPAPWSWGRVNALEEVIRKANPLKLWIQWVPHLYQQHGIVPMMSRLLRRLRHYPLSVELMVHELWTDGPSWQAKTLGHLQRRSLLALIPDADHILVSSYPWVTLLQDLAPNHRHRVHWMPIPSTMPYAFVSQDVRTESCHLLGIETDRPIILIFSPGGSGVDHPLLCRAWEMVQKNVPKAQLVVVGQTPDLFHKSLTQATQESNRQSLIWLGPRDPSTINFLLQAADLQLAPFVDGVSSRRTTVMAAMQHGLCVLTTEPRSIPGDPLRDSGLVMIPRGDTEAFASMAVQLLQQPLQRHQRALRGQQYYSDWHSPYRLQLRLQEIYGDAVPLSENNQSRRLAACQ